MTAAQRSRTISALEQLIAKSTTPAAMRRSATLRLGRLRAAMWQQMTGKASIPAPRPRPAAINIPKVSPAKPAPRAPVAPSEKAKFEAVQSFRALASQRSALYRKRRRTAGEQEAFVTLTALMPAAIPTGDDAKAWCNFIAVIDGTLSEIKSIKPL